MLHGLPWWLGGKESGCHVMNCIHLSWVLIYLEFYPQLENNQGIANDKMVMNKTVWITFKLCQIIILLYSVGLVRVAIGINKEINVVYK